MKFFTLTFLLVASVFLMSCSNEEQFNKDVLGNWQQIYTKNKTEPYEKLNITIESQNKGVLLKELIHSSTKKDTIQHLEITKIEFYTIGESEFIKFNYSNLDIYDQYEVHQIRPDYLYLIKEGELITLTRKYNN